MKAHIWYGTFPSEAEFLKYADHNKSKCPFMKDFPFEYDGEWFLHTYQHPKETWREALIRLYYSVGYVDELQKLLKKKKSAAKANAFKVILAKKDLPGDTWPKDKPLQFLGAIEFSNRAVMIHPEMPREPRLDHEGWASIWIGTAPSTEFMEDYMEERDDDDEDTGKPISKFGRDWQLTYDHDYLFYEAYRKPVSVQALLKGWEDLPPVLKEAAAAAQKAGVASGNVVVVAYGLDYRAKPPFSSLNNAGYFRHKGKPKKSCLQFIGAFQYKQP